MSSIRARPTPLFDVGALEFTAGKGGRALAPRTLQITATSTVQDLMTFMQEAIGIQTTAERPADSRLAQQHSHRERHAARRASRSSDGQIRIVSNNGEANAVEIDASSAFG